MTAEKDTVDEESSLEAELGAVFDEVNKEDEPEVAVEKEPAKAKSEQKEEETEVEETPPELESTEEEPVSEEQQEEPEEKVVPPASWTTEAKDKFSGLDPAIQQEVLKREKDYARGIEKNASLAKQAEVYEQVISPYRAMIQSEGSDPVRAIQSLLNTAYTLRSGTNEQKVGLMKQLAQQYNIQMDDVSSDYNEDEYIDPEIKALREEISSLKNTTQSQIQLQQNQQLQSYQQQIDAFASDPKHEHFDKVRDQMSALLTGGSASTLEEAYEKSLYLVDDLRQSLLDKQLSLIHI